MVERNQGYYFFSNLFNVHYAYQQMLLLLLTVPMYTALYTTHMPCLIAAVYIPMYTKVYPCTQHCTVHTCHVLLLLLSTYPCTSRYTHVHSIVQYTHATSYCLIAVVYIPMYIKVYPCTQHCTVHTCHVLLLLLSTYPCTPRYTHVHSIVQYTHATSYCCCCLHTHVHQGIPMYTALYSTHMPRLIAAVVYIPMYTKVYPCTQHCTVHTCHEGYQVDSAAKATR